VPRIGIALLGMVLPFAAPLAAQEAAPPPAAQVTLTPAQLFDFADRARDAGDYDTAETAYRALASNPDIELRTEARFRLGLMLADQLQKYREAAVEFRRILDEKPRAARVRLELARMQALIGNAGAAQRELRAAEAAGLPPEVEQMVRFYAASLGELKSFGGSIEVALAPDSNVNRATRSNTLGTVIGDFTLDEDAQARSGIGLALRGQTWLRKRLSSKVALVTRVAGSADIYRDSRFDDLILSLQAGPELRSGRDKITLQGGPSWRWYGLDPYSVTLGGSAEWLHPMGKRAQLRLSGGGGRTTNRRNTLQDATVWSLAAGIDRAFTPRFGGGLQLSGSREAARDPGWSTAGGGVSAYLFREIGGTTAVVSLGYNHLEADARLALFPERRRDDRFTASLAGTFRHLRIGTFAPFVRVRWERNSSTVEIYDYRRVAGEAGLTAAF